MDDAEYWERFCGQVARVFDDHPELDDHRERYPWLMGALGDPAAPVWFLAENPSLTQVALAGQVRTPEAQWSQSRGDKLFRDVLVKLGLKSGGASSDGGWSCYITDVVKSAAIAGAWAALPMSRKKQVAEMWAPVLDFELNAGNPAVIVCLGERADLLLDHLRRHRLVPGSPPAVRVDHYSYISMRPETSGLRRKQMDPGRVADWRESIRRAIDNST